MANYAHNDFLDRRTRSPIGLGAALTINGAIIAALLTVNPQVTREIATVLKTKHVPLDQPKPLPPPPPPEQRVVKPQPPRSAVDAIKSVVSEPDTSFVTRVTPPTPPLPGTGAIGSGGTGAVIDPPAREPVYVGPQLDRGFTRVLQPPYPPGKVRAEEEGVVVVKVLIGPDGRVVRVEKVEGDDGFFRATAEHAARRWRFKPATRDGVAVEGWRTMTVRFELDR